MKIINNKNSITQSLNVSGSKHIVVIAGGPSREAEISMISAKAVCKSLIRLGFKVTLVNLGMDIASVILSLKPDIVYNCIHGKYGEDGNLQGVLNIMRIPYTHSGVAASSMGFNKLHSHMWFCANNILTPELKIVNKSDNLRCDPMSRPYVIKPIDQGSSIGVEVVFQKDDFDFGKYDFPYGDSVMIERYIKGREMQVAVLNGLVLGVLEIELLKKRFYDYETKYTEGFANHICPAKIEKEIEDKLIKISGKIYSGFGCNGAARIEYIYSIEDQKIYVLELNTHPGMTPLSIVPEIANICCNMSFDEVVMQLLQSAKYEK